MTNELLFSARVALFCFGVAFIALGITLISVAVGWKS